MKRVIFFVILVVIVLTGAVSGGAQDRTQMRSMAISRYGIVASENPLASQAGAQVLASGGNAIDAAIATNAVIGVVEPMMNGMGGDLFVIVYEAKTGKVYGLNASGWSPKALTPEHLKSKGITEMPQNGIDSVTVPGAVDGWSKLQTRFGKQNFSQVLAPAIRYAREGFPVAEWAAAYWAGGAEALSKSPSAASIYLPDGRSPQVGQIFRNEALARSLEMVAAGGRDAFYKGELAQKIIEFSRTQGGTMTAEDLADFSSVWVDPISTDYRGWTVYEIPPNGQGIAALIMLNLMEKFPLGKYGHNSPDALHVMIEAKKLAYADMLKYVGDPNYSKIPVAGMLSKAYATERAKLIDPAKANCSVSAGTPDFSGGDTMYLSVVDKEGNLVSFIQSNYGGFGSRLAVAGFALQNRGGLFNLEAGSPDVLAGHKRPLHTIIPAFMSKDDRRIAFGIMGGFNQSQAHAQFVSNVVDFGMNIQAALEVPRFTKGTFTGCDVTVEDRIPANVRTALQAHGHDVRVVGAFSATMGGGQATERNFKTGVNFGGSDPRKDGQAIPEQIPSR